jgi:hypothetical protein
MSEKLVTVKTPDGSLGTVTEDTLQYALKEGYSVASNEEINHYNALVDAGESPVIAGLESAASAATFGLSRELENISGLTTPEAQALRQEANPIASGIGTTLGVVAPIALTMGAAAPAVAGSQALRAASTAAKFTPIGAVTKASAAATEAVTPALKAAMSGLAQTSPRLAGALATGAATGAVGAVEGAVYGVGQSIDEHALGDPEAFGENLISNVGINAALGGGIGSIFGGVSGALNAPKAIKAELLGDDLATKTMAKDGVEKVGVQPTSLDELRAKSADFGDYELPQKTAVEDAISRLALENPIHPMQMSSLESKAGKDAYKSILSKEDDVGKQFLNHEFRLKNETVQKTAQTLEEIAPGHEITSNAIEAGEHLNKSFRDPYKLIKETEGPIIGEFKKLQSQGFDHLNGVIDAFTAKNPEIAKMIKVTDGAIEVVPYKTSIGITKETYSAVKDAVKSLSDNPQDFASLFNIRTNLATDLSKVANSTSQAQIGQLKATMMDYMQGMVDSTMPELRPTFAKYAINEENKKIIEKVFGGSVDEVERGIISKSVKEEIARNVFSDSVTTDAAKKILGKEKFNEALSNYIANAMESATTDGAFSGAKFKRFLDRNESVLSVAFTENPGALQKIKDLNTVARILPDSVKISTGGPSKSFFDVIRGINSLGDVAGMAKDYTYGIIENKIQLKNIENALAGRAEKATIMTKIKSMADKTQRAIESSAKAVFSDTGSSMTIGIGSGLIHTDDPKEVEKTMEKVKELSSDPERTMNALEKNTDKLHSFAPDTAMSVQKSMVAATQYLASKIPQPANQKILSEDYKPSRSDLMKFNDAYQTIKTPTSILAGIKHGMVTSEQLNALKAVYPKMLEQMQMAVIEQLSDHMAKNKDITYKTKLGLSQFLDRPLTNSMTQESIAMNQMSSKPDDQQGGGVKPTQKGLGSLNESGRIKTNMQSISNSEEA